MDQIVSKSTATSKKNILSRIADVPGGVSLVMSNLPAGIVIEEANPISAPSSGKRTVCKQAKLVDTSNTTTFPVATATNPFKVGDFLCTKIGGKAYAISTIASSNGVDTITVGTAIDAQSDGWVYEATAEATGAVIADATLNIAVAHGTTTGLTDDATSDAAPARAGYQGTVATIAGTIGAAGAGDASITISTDLHADVVLTVALANNDAPTVSAQKIAAAALANSVLQSLGAIVEVADTKVFIYVPVSIDGSTFKNTPDAILKNSFEVPSTTQVIFMADAFLQANVAEDAIAPAYLAQLKTINVVKY